MNRPAWMPTMKPSPLPAPYVRQPMTRAWAYDVAIAFGMACQDSGVFIPIQPRPAGNGFDATIPMEWIEHLPMLAPYLPPKPPQPEDKPDVDPPEFKPESE